MPETNRRAFLKTVGVAGAATMLGGVGVVGADNHTNDDDDDGASVRVVHASPDAPNVDVYVDGSKVLSDVPFETVSDYLSLDAGTYTVTITAAGDPETVAFEGHVTVEDADYTIAATGELSEETFAPLVLEDAPSEPSEGNAQVRLVHASPDAPAVDVTVEGADLTLFDGVDFGEHTEYVEVPAGDYTLEVRGDTEGNDGDVVATFDVSVEAGMSYTAFATGYLTPDDEPEHRPFNLLVATDGAGMEEPAEAAVRVVHASPDAPNVDVYVDGSKVLSDVPYEAISDYLSLEPGTYTVTITATGDPETVAFEGDVTVEDADYTIAATGELSEETFAPLVLEDAPSEPSEGNAQVRLVHASPDAPAVDVTVEGADLTLFDGVAFGEHTEYVEVPAGDYTLEVRGDTEENDGDVVTTFDVTVEEGTSYTAFATGYLTPDDEPEHRPFNLLVATDGAGMDEKASVRAVHAIPDAPSVDIYVDGEKVLSDVPFRAVSDYLSVPVGDRSVKVTAAGDPETVVLDETLPVSEGAFTVTAIGELSEETQAPLVLTDDTTKPADDTAKVRLVHASPDAPAVDVTVEGADLTLFDGVAFGEHTEYVEVPAGDYTLEVRGDTEENDGDVVATFDVTVEGGMAYTAFATGYLTPDDEPSSCPFDLVVASDMTMESKDEMEDDSEESAMEGDEASEMESSGMAADVEANGC